MEFSLNRQHTVESYLFVGVKCSWILGVPHRHLFHTWATLLLLRVAHVWNKCLWGTLTHKLMSPWTFNKLMNCLTLQSNKRVCPRNYVPTKAAKFWQFTNIGPDEEYDFTVLLNWNFSVLLMLKIPSTIEIMGNQF